MISQHFVREETMWDIPTTVKPYTLDDVDCVEAQGLVLAELDDHPEITDIVLLMEDVNVYKYVLLSLDEAKQLAALLMQRISFHQSRKET